MSTDKSVTPPRQASTLSTAFASWLWAARPTWPRLRSLGRALLTSYLALGITLYILPGRQSSGPLPVLGLVLVVAVVGMLLRPVLLALAAVLGSIGLLVVGVLTQAIILDVAIGFAPDIEISTRSEVIAVSWIAAAVAATVNWLFDAGSAESFFNQLLSRAVRVARRQRRTGIPAGRGTLIVQLDGVSEGVLRQALTGGAVPTLSSWLRAGRHQLRGWHTGLPATTPAGQAVLLYGDTTEIPSFRWYEKETGRLMVANHPRDAAIIEQRLSTGNGLLAHGGVSVSNLFCGDADTTLLTMSDARLPPRSTRGLASFATARGGLARSIVVFAGQVVAELYQGRRQRRRNVQPRVHRGTVFALLRGVTTALLRDLDVALVAEQIARGAPVIFVDFLDYDEVAHHAGPTRPESLRTLDGLDRLLRFFDDVITATGQDYEIVVVSDHGQAQGATFGQLAGRSLHDLVAELRDGDHASRAPADQCDDRDGAVTGADSAPAERFGPANLLLTGLARSAGLAGRAMNRRRDPEGQVTLGPRAVAEAAPATGEGLVVAAAGSLAHIYLADLPGRVDRAVIESVHPRLIEGLRTHPQIGAVLVRSEGDGGLIVLGGRGWRRLDGGEVLDGEGVNPLAAYGSRAAADLTSLDRRRHVGDLVLLGRFDPRTRDVVAFEELVGSHGGLGGEQTSAVFIHPAGWSVDESGPLSGRQVHEALMAGVVRDRPAVVPSEVAR